MKSRPTCIIDGALCVWTGSGWTPRHEIEERLQYATSSAVDAERCGQVLAAVTHFDDAQHLRAILREAGQ